MPPELHHLPDLPHAGYSTYRQKATSDAIMHFMRGVERNRPFLLTLVLSGREKWRGVAGKVWRGLLMDRDLLDAIFDYFVLQAGRDPDGQLKTLEGIEALKIQAPAIDARLLDISQELKRWGRI